MKRFFLLITLAALYICGAYAQFAPGSTVYVAAKTLKVKASTGFFAGTRGTLSYGAQVRVLQVKGNWSEIQSLGGNSLRGWVNTSNLTSKRINPAGTGTSASAREVALAGKGFNQEVENVYRAEGSLNYAGVNAVETIIVSDRDLYNFLVEGRLAMGNHE
jgi:uncharacterized protein YgiM (DUF1202 family)